MRRGWIIRGLFVLLILLCGGGWGWSGGHSMYLCYGRHGRWVGGNSEAGAITFYWASGSRLRDGWGYGDAGSEFLYFVPPYDAGGPDVQRFFGFSIGRVYLMMSDRVYAVGVPYWSLVVAASGVFFFVWRKTRPNVDSRRAFPVGEEKE